MTPLKPKTLHQETDFAFTVSDLQRSRLISIRSATVVLFLSLITCLLVVASIYADYLQLHRASDDQFMINYVALFYLPHENNLPTLFSTALLFGASFLNLLIGCSSSNAAQPTVKWYWCGLSVLFLFLGLDESLQIHDRLSHFKAIDNLSAESSLFYYAWVVPYGVAALAIGIVFLRFLLQLPTSIRVRFIIAGVVYVGGALGFEMAESYERTHASALSVTMLERCYYTIEETMEMAGVILFIHALLDYLGMKEVKFQINRTSDAVLRSV